LLVHLFIYCFAARVLKVCRTPSPTACSKTKMLDRWWIDNYQTMHNAFCAWFLQYHISPEMCYHNSYNKFIINLHLSFFVPHFFLRYHKMGFDYTMEIIQNYWIHGRGTFHTVLAVANRYSGIILLVINSWDMWSSINFSQLIWWYFILRYSSSATIMLRKINKHVWIQ